MHLERFWIEKSQWTELCVTPLSRGWGDKLSRRGGWVEVFCTNFSFREVTIHQMVENHIFTTVSRVQLLPSLSFKRF